MNPLLLVDSYKIHHTKMYPDGMTKLYSNFTPRKSRIPGIESVVTFGLQHFIKEYLIDRFNNEFFRTDFRQGSDNKNYWYNKNTKIVYLTDCHKKNPKQAIGKFLINNNLVEQL